MPAARFLAPLSLALLLGAWQALPAQWLQLRSTNTDVYYLPGHEAAAARVARYAEIARYELGVLFDYKPRHRYTLTYAAAAHALPPPMLPEAMPGRIALYSLDAQVLHPGSLAGLYAATKQAVASLMLREFSLGQGFSPFRQAQSALNSPAWFMEGLAAYAAHGWGPLDDARLASLGGGPLLAHALEGQDATAALARRSVWHYLTREYGAHKIAEIVYLAVLSHSVESGVIAVLGVSLEAFTTRWETYMGAYAATLRQARTGAGDMAGAGRLPLPAGKALGSWDYAPAGQWVGAHLVSGGRYGLWVCRAGTGQWAQWGKRRPLPPGGQAPPPLAVRPDGGAVFTLQWSGPAGAYLLALHEAPGAGRGAGLRLWPLPPGLAGITSATWDAAGQRVIVAGLRPSGQTDLWRVNPEDGSAEALTNDAADDAQPWAGPGGEVYFASTRDSARLGAGAGPAGGAPEWDLFALTGAQVVRLCRSPGEAEAWPVGVGANEVAHVSVHSGLPNLAKTILLGRGQTDLHTDLPSGMEALRGNADGLMASIWGPGGAELWRLPAGVLEQPRTPAPTALRLHLARQAATRDDPALALRDALRAAPGGLAAVPAPPPAGARPASGADSAGPAAPGRGAVRYYIFDEEDAPYEVRPVSPPVGQEGAGGGSGGGVPAARPPVGPVLTVFGSAPRPRYDSVAVAAQAPAQRPWALQYWGLRPVYAPLAGPGVAVEVAAHDLRRRQVWSLGVTPYGRLQESAWRPAWDASLRYAYRPGRWAWSAGLAGSSRRYRIINPAQGRTQQTINAADYRFDMREAEAGLGRQLGRRLWVRAGARVSGVQRQRINPLNATLRDTADVVPQGLVAVEYDAVQAHQGYRYAGVYARADWRSAWGVGMGGWMFHSPGLVVRGYQPLGRRRAVLAVQAQAGASMGPGAQVFRLGGLPDWIQALGLPDIGETADQDRRMAAPVSQDLYEFHFQEFLLPLHGFRFNARQGNKYAVANAEVRLPLTRMLRESLNTGPLYNVALIGFVEGGTVWEQGNPFSQRNPTDLRIVTAPPVVVALQTLKSPFLFGTGVGVRANVLGYSVRTDLGWGIDDYAFQRPVLSVSVAQDF